MTSGIALSAFRKSLQTFNNIFIWWTTFWLCQNIAITLGDLSNQRLFIHTELYKCVYDAKFFYTPLVSSTWYYTFICTELRSPIKSPFFNFHFLCYFNIFWTFLICFRTQKKISNQILLNKNFIELHLLVYWVSNYINCNRQGQNLKVSLQWQKVSVSS